MLQRSSRSFTAQTGRPMTIRDLIVAVRVADPQLSPDGQSVAFVRTTTDPASGKRNADIWVAPADQVGAPKPLIAGDKSENTPRWSPDGRQLAFISTRDGDPQVYLAGRRRRERAQDHRRVRRRAAAARVLARRDDGRVRRRRLSRVQGRRVQPAAARGRGQGSGQGARPHAAAVSPLGRVARGRAPPRVRRAGRAAGAARDLTPGDFDSPPGQQEDAAIAFTPDSKTLAFVSNREGNDKEAWTTNNDVWSVPVTGGDAKKLTRESRGGRPAGRSRRDGKIVIVRAQRRPGFESDRWYLDVYDRATGAKRTLFETPDLSVSDFTLSRTARRSTSPRHEQGHGQSVPRAARGRHASGGRGTGGAISALDRGAGRRRVFSKSTLTAPAESSRSALIAAVRSRRHADAREQRRG